MTGHAPHTAPPPALFPVRWPREYRRLAESLGPDSALLRMGDARADATVVAPCRADPTGDLARRPLPHLVRKHPDRVLILAATRCFFYCRFCFRRGQALPAEAGPAAAEWAAMFAYVAADAGIREVILSGGDPLTLPNRRLAAVGRRLAAIPHLQAWRIHSRAPVVLPRRVEDGLLGALATPLPARLVLHLNHPAELTPAVLAAIARLHSAGVAVWSQSVLLRGVNSDPATLLGLFQGLAAAGVHLHYLHHPDPAPGNERFRLSPAAGLALWRDLEARWSRQGAAVPLPRYVLDQPDGSGKVDVARLLAAAPPPAAG